MKIVIIGTKASSILGFRKDLIIKLKANNHIIYAFANDYSSQKKREVELLGAIPVDYDISRTGLNPFKDFMTVLQLRTILKDIKPDIVFSFFAKPVIFGTLAAKLAKVPRIIGMLEGLGYTFTPQPMGISWKARIIRAVQIFLYRISFPCLDKIILLNNDDYDDLIKKYKLKVKSAAILGPIGLNLSDYPYIEAPISPIKFIFIGRLLADKGINEYVAAAKIIKNKHPDVQFIILGGLDVDNPGGLSKEQLDALVSDDIIIHPGHVSDVKEWIINASVFVLPSYREGAPRSTQEAMAIGRAVITTDAPGCKDTVDDGINGFLVSRFDIDNLAKKMEFFIDNKHKVIEMGNESYKIAIQKFDADEVNSRLIELLIKK